MAADVTLTGTLVDVGGNPIQGSVTFTLANFGNVPPIISGTDLLATLQVTALADLSGVWSTTLFSNASITPKNTFYSVAISGTGNFAPNISAAYVFSAGSFDLSNLTPILAIPGAALGLVGPQGPAGAAGSNGTNGTAGATGATGAAGAKAQPYLDIQDYGGLPKNITNAQESTTATTNGTTTVAIGAAKHFVNGEGVVIYQAGSAPATALQSAPSAPTATCPAISGSGPSNATQTISYQIAAFDAHGGISPASTAGTVTSPAIFGTPRLAISSISQSGDVVTVTFATPIAVNVAAGMTLHLIGFGAVTGDKIFNGIWTIASVSNSGMTVTFALAGSYGSGTVSASTLGRVSNTAIISSVSRDATGLITINTVEPHNFTTQSGENPTLIILENISPADLNGTFVVASASGSAITCKSGNLTPETGIVAANSTTSSCSTATVWEYNTVACPALSGAIVGYYIYSDSPNPGGSLSLIGMTLYGESHFVDYGPCLQSGFIRPAYVPTAPPVAFQNQSFRSSIVSGGTTTTLVLNDIPPTSISSLGATIVHDDSLALANAAAARSNGAVFLSPPTSLSVTAPTYILNYGVSLPADVDLFFGAGLIINETLIAPAGNNLSMPYGSAFTVNPQFSNQSYSGIFGNASPMLFCGGANTLDGLGFVPSSNGVNPVMITGSWVSVRNCSITTGANAASVPLVINGGCADIRVSNCNFGASTVFGVTPVTGQSSFGPPNLAAIWLRASDNSAQSGIGPANFYMDGTNTMNGRGILVDGQYRTTGAATFYKFGDFIWNQATSTPAVAFYGQFYSDVEISGVLNDSSFAPILANWCPQSLSNVDIRNCVNAGGAAITGNAITQLTARGITILGQTENMVQQIVGSADVGSVGFPPTVGETIQAQCLMMGLGTAFFQQVPLATVTASASGVGTWSAGSHTIGVHYVGGEGGLTAPSFTKVTVNGSQGILIGWNALAGFTVRVSVDGQLQNIALQTGTSVTLAGNATLTTAPTIDGSGMPFLNSSIAVLPKLVLPIGGAPSTSSSTGIPGQIGWDATHVYICVAANTWVRATLATF